MAIDPKYSNTLYGVLSAKIKTYLIHLPWSTLFLFFSFFFSSYSLIIFNTCPSPSPWTWSPCSITWYVPTLLTWHLWQRLVLRFHQLAKTKLELSVGRGRWTGHSYGLRRGRERALSPSVTRASSDLVPFSFLFYVGCWDSPVGGPRRQPTIRLDWDWEMHLDALWAPDVRALVPPIK